MALRGGVVAMALFVAALLVRDFAGAIAARLGAAFALGVAAFAVSSTPGFTIPPVWWQAPLHAFSAGNAIVFWLFARALFDDDFKLRYWHAGAWTVLALLGIANCFLLAPSHAAAAPIGLLLKLATILFAALAVFQSLATWREDLIEGRRRLRLFIVGAAAAYTMANTLSQFFLPHEPVSTLGSAINAFSLAIVTLGIIWCMVRIADAGLFTTVRTSESKEDAEAANLIDSPVPEKSLDQADRKIIDALEHLMHDENIYREEKLSIGDLAARLGQPEYKLRRLINQGLGYRNFNVFLNRYRINDTKIALSDPQQTNVPVLTIAMDAGFQSLGPFNRAFKSETGMTPTEFRRLYFPESLQRLAESGIG